MLVGLLLIGAISPSTTLLQLIAMSGGIDSDVSDSTVVLFRNTDGQRYAAKFNVDAVRTGQEPDPLIFPGDAVVANSSPLKSAWSEFIKAAQPATAAKTIAGR